MDTITLAIAREDWTHEPCRSSETLCADDLITLAVGCERAQHAPTAPLTREDAAILMRRAPGLDMRRPDYTYFGNNPNVLRYVANLNA